MSGESHEKRIFDTAEQVLQAALKAGASDADVMASRGTEFEVKVADGEIVTLTQATSKGLGLRVFVDGRCGISRTGDFTPESLALAAERAVSMAQEAAADPYNGLGEAEPGRIDGDDALELYDPAIAEVPAEEKIAWAHALEGAARGVDPRVRKFRDSGVSSGDAYSVLVTSRGVQRTLRSSGISVWCNPIAEDNGDLQTEFWYDSRTHLEDLASVESVGRTAGERAVRMLGAKPVATQNVPVIFEPHMAAGLIAGMTGAINGDMVYKKASFLAERLNQQIAAPTLNLVDDPLMRRGTGSTPFDGEGFKTGRKRLLDRGVLTTFLYDSYTARKAGTQSTANAQRGLGGIPSAGAFNLYVEAGDANPADIHNCERALLVTRGLGSGVNTVTGEYSRGANGLWIENGEVIHPVQEVTIAGDFLAMLQNIDAVGSDLRMRGSLGAPTLRIAEMTVSGRR